MPTLEVIQGLRGRKRQKQQVVVNSSVPFLDSPGAIFGRGGLFGGDGVVDRGLQFVDKTLLTPMANVVSGAIKSLGSIVNMVPKIVEGSFAGATGSGDRPRGAEQSGQGTGQNQGEQPTQAGLFSDPKTLLLIGGAAIVATMLFKNSDPTKGDKFAQKRRKRR